jgi:hypothetical protein
LVYIKAMPGRSQKEMYDMRKPREIYKPILLVKRKNGMYQQQNFKEIEAAKGKSDGDKKEEEKKKGGKRRTLKKRTLKKRTLKNTRKYKKRY